MSDQVQRVREAPSEGVDRLVVVVDPLDVVRAGLDMLVERQAGFALHASAGSALDAYEVLSAMRRHSGTVVLVGLALTGEQNAFWLIRTIREKFPTVVAVACGAHSDTRTISRALFAGADGYVDKASRPEEFFKVIHLCAMGELTIGGAKAGSIADIADAFEQQIANEPTLTGRERDVLQVAAEGLTAKQIGNRLGLRERTVTTHLGHIYSKLGVSTRVAAISAATRSGLVTEAVGGSIS